MKKQLASSPAHSCMKCRIGHTSKVRTNIYGIGKHQRDAYKNHDRFGELFTKSAGKPLSRDHADSRAHHLHKGH